MAGDLEQREKLNQVLGDPCRRFNDVPLSLMLAGKDGRATVARLLTMWSREVVREGTLSVAQHPRSISTSSPLARITISTASHLDFAHLGHVIGKV